MLTDSSHIHVFSVQAFGVVVKLSDGILGLTLLAWGNSIGGLCTRIVSQIDKMLASVYIT